jgi:hypothetical protein
MSIKSLISDIAKIKRSIHTDTPCECRYLEVVKDQPLTKDQQTTLAINLACRDEHPDPHQHVGWSYAEVPAPPPAS